MHLPQILDMIKTIYEELPFNKVLGLTVARLTETEAGFRFPMREELVGNTFHGILHGGVISAVLDATGGLTATASALHNILDSSNPQEIIRRISRIGTIDMRVDYLRPGKGREFFSTGTVMRTGKRLAVTRMELKNESDSLIAVGTGAYIVG